MYKNAHIKIRENPSTEKKPPRKDVKVKRSVCFVFGSTFKMLGVFFCFFLDGIVPR